jgi:hypothetical protein
MRYVPLAERFWMKVDKSGECWLWTAYRSRDGYGMIGLERTGVERAHRVAWQLTNGPIPVGLQVLHRCDNPPCVNPAHLWLGTQPENIADMIAKGRARKNPLRGSAQPRSKLTEADVHVIRQLIAAGMGNTAIGRRYGVHRVTIHWIRIGKNWAHLSTDTDDLLPNSPLIDEP